MLNRKINLKGAYIVIASVFITSLTSGPAIAQVDILQPSKANKTTGITSLMSAVLEADIEGVKFFVRSQPENINSRNFGGATALHIASRNHDPEIVRILIQNGADVNIKDSEGWTPLMRASLAKDAETVDVLLANGAKLLEENEFRETAIIHASTSDCELCLGLMMEKVNINNKEDKKVARKQINDAFIIARNHGNFDSQDILKSGIDDIYENEKKKKENSKKLAAKRKAEALAASRERARRNAEEKMLKEKLAQREAERKKQELEKARAEAQRIIQEKIAQEEAQKKALELAQEKELAAQQKNNVETVDLSLGEDKKEPEGVSAFKKAEEIVKIPKKSFGFGFFGLFGGNNDSSKSNKNIVEEKPVEIAKQVEVANENINQDSVEENIAVLSQEVDSVDESEMIVEDMDIPAPTKIIDRENEVKEIAVEEEKLEVADLLAPVIVEEKVIEEVKEIAEPEEVEQVEEKEEIVANEEEKKSGSFFGKLFGFSDKKVEKVEIAEDIEDEISEPTTIKEEQAIAEPIKVEETQEVSEPAPIEEIEDKEAIVTEEAEPIKEKKSGSFFGRLFGFDDNKEEQIETVEDSELTTIEEPNSIKKIQPIEEPAIVEEKVEEVVAKEPAKKVEAVKEKPVKEVRKPAKKHKKFRFKSGPSIMKPELTVAEPPAMPEEIQEEEEVKKSFFARLFSWFGSNDKNEDQDIVEPTQLEEELQESDLQEVEKIEEPEVEETISEPEASNEEPVKEEPKKSKPKLIEVRPISEPEPSSSIFSIFSDKKNSFSEHDLEEIVEEEEQQQEQVVEDSDISSSDTSEEEVKEEIQEVEEVESNETQIQQESVDNEIIAETEEELVEEEKEDSGFSFFGLFSDSDDEESEELIEKDLTDEIEEQDEAVEEVKEELEEVIQEKPEVIEEVKEEESEEKEDSGFSFFGLFSSSDKAEEAPVLKKKASKFHFNKGPVLEVKQEEAPVEVEEEIEEIVIEEPKEEVEENLDSNIEIEEIEEEKSGGLFDFLFGSSKKEEPKEVTEKEVVEEELTKEKPQKRKFKIISGIR